MRISDWSSDVCSSDVLHAESTPYPNHKSTTPQNNKASKSHTPDPTPHTSSTGTGTHRDPLEQQRGPIREPGGGLVEQLRHGLGLPGGGLGGAQADLHLIRGVGRSEARRAGKEG